jgi:hypothetical protein
MDRTKATLLGLLMITVIVLGVGSWFSYSTLAEKNRTIETLTKEKATLESELVEKTSEKTVIYDPKTGQKVSETVKETYAKKTEKSKTSKVSKTKETESSKVVVAARTNHILGSYGIGSDLNKQMGLTYVKSFSVLDVGAGVESRTDLTKPEAKVFVGLNF